VSTAAEDDHKLMATTVAGSHMEVESHMKNKVVANVICTAASVSGLVALASVVGAGRKWI
jgi:hypothetical protein